MNANALPHEGRHAIRRLAKSPGYLLATVLMLSIGAGSAVFMFGAIQAYILLAAGFAQVLAGNFTDVSSLDPPTYPAVFGMLVLLIVIASFVPTRRALRVQPQEALRSE